MANALRITVFLLLTPLSWLPNPAWAHYARVASRTPSDIVKKALPTVVTINCTRTPTPADKHSMGVGSGVILREDGLIVTSYHVIEGAEKITVALQGKADPLKARALAVDSRSDIALLRLDQPPPRLPTLKLGDSDRLQVGDLAIAVGNPFGFSHTVTLGIVSARGRNGAFMGPYGDQGPEVDDMIQTDAAINPGNSGGPLLNSEGEMIGLNAAIFSQNGAFIGIGFAIPSKVVREITDQLLKNGRVVRGWLGITAQSLDGRLARRFHSEPHGALISDIRANGPASEAGLKPGDIIKSFDRQPVEDSSVLRTLTAKTSSGRTVDVEYLRNSKLSMTKVRIREQPSTGPDGDPDGGLAGLPAKQDDRPKHLKNASDLGLAMQNVPSDLRSMMGLDSKQGVLVGQVTPGSPAAEAGLSSGDVLLHIEGDAVSNLDEASARISKWLKSRKNGEDSLLVLVQRGPGDRVYMAVPVN